MVTSSTEHGNLAGDVTLRDGATVRARPARAEDLRRVEDYLIALSDESRRLRFGSPTVNVGEVAGRVVSGNDDGHLALLALHGGEAGTVVGGAQYFRLDPTRAEVSLSVADDYQGRGLGTLLLARLAAAARNAGIDRFVAYVAPANHRMIDVFRDCGFEPTIRARPGSVEVEFPTEITEDAARSFEEREREAARNAVTTLLTPRSVAVIGASRDPASIGARVFRNVLRSGFQGVVYPVNPKATSIEGVAASPSVLEVPGDVDVAIVCVPAAAVLDVARACGEKGVRGLVVITSGFSETGDAGRALQDDLLAVCRSHGMRLVGPNCMGILNTDPQISLNATFAPGTPLPGRVGFMSQSGALGIAVIEHANQLGLGLSSFVSAGNKADISGNDLLAYWRADPRTDVVMLYLESFGNPRRFSVLAREVSRDKAIVAVKSGRSAAGMRATASHTGALLRAADEVTESLFHQSGVIRTDTLEQMLHVTSVLANQPLPQGDRVGIITNAGGLGILCADVAEANGLTVPQLSDAASAAIAASLPGQASVANPIDMIASASGEDYAKTIRILGASGEVDALVVIYIPPIETADDDIATGVVGAIDELEGAIPVISSFLTPAGEPVQLRSKRGIVPSFSYPEQAAIALGRVAKLSRWRRRPAGHVRRFADVRGSEAGAIVAESLAEGGGWLSPERAIALLDCYGIQVPRWVRAATPEEAAAAARRIGTSVVLKAIGPLHKTDADAVRVGLSSPDVVFQEASEMQERLHIAGLPLEGFLLQETVEGHEMIVGMALDPTFGPVIVCGAGGTTAELIRDVSVRVTPLTDVDAAEMVRSLRTFPILSGYRGAPPADVASLEELILRVAAMVDAHQEIAEMDCNPVFVRESGSLVADVRIRVSAT
jgi:acetyl coenzyme A synthetase (ADP forming)-like protein